jgi:opacity protein-like surface antigen
MKSLYIALAFTFAIPAVNPQLAAAEKVEKESEHPTGYRHRHIRRRRRVVRVHPRTQTVKRNRRAGIYLGVGVVGNYFVQTDNKVSKTYTGGAGLNLHWGFRFSPYAALEFNFMSAFQAAETTGTAQIRNGSVSALSVDGKFYLLPRYARFEPFVQLGAGVYMLSEQYEEKLSGPGFRVGAGVDIQLNPVVSVGGRLLYHGFQVDNSEAHYNGIVTESAFLNTVTLQGNVQFHF